MSVVRKNLPPAANTVAAATEQHTPMRSLKELMPTLEER
jgi:hypothetical protein